MGFILCHICGRKYGLHSITIHIPSCAEKWQTQQSNIPQKYRRPVPSPPIHFHQIVSGKLNGKAKANAIQGYNSEAKDIFESSTADIRCAKCRQVVSWESFGEHYKLCQTADLGTREPIRQDCSIICHICGRKYGTASISIHIPKCEKKWESYQASRPETEKLPCPTMPDDLSQLLSSHLRGSELRTALYEYNTTGHFASTSDPSQSDEIEIKESIRQDCSLICYICGQRYGTASISIHIPKCERKWEIYQGSCLENESLPCPTMPEDLAQLLASNLKGAELRKALYEYNISHFSSISSSTRSQSSLGSSKRDISDQESHASNVQTKKLSMRLELSLEIESASKVKNFQKSVDEAKMRCFNCKLFFTAKEFKDHWINCSQEIREHSDEDLDQDDTQN